MQKAGMETNYVIDVTTNNEVKFIPDYMEALFTPQEELIEQIAESFNYSHTDAEAYAERLKRMTLAEYNNAFRGTNNAEI